MIFPVFYFGPVSYFKELIDANNPYFEVHENFPKQTYRNRCYIQGANGKLRLAIPVRHNGKRAMKEIEISYESNWQKEHFKSLVSAYQSSPYFEYYEDGIAEIYARKEKFLLDLNFKTLEFIDAKLNLNLNLANRTESIKHRMKIQISETVSRPNLKQRLKCLNICRCSTKNSDSCLI